MTHIKTLDYLLEPHEPATSSIEHGMVGWEDEDDYFFLGDDSNDGHTLIRVQLFRGRDLTKELKPDTAQGIKLVCHLSGGLYRIPPKGTRVFVALPKDMETVPGAGVIFATIEKSPVDQFSDKRVKMDFGPDTDLVIKARSVTITDYDNRFICVGPDNGIAVQDKDGSGLMVQSGALMLMVSQTSQVKTLIQMSNQKIEIGVNGGSALLMDPLQAQLFGINTFIQGVGVFLGMGATPATGVSYGPPGPGPVVLSSATVYVSP